MLEEKSKVREKIWVGLYLVEKIEICHIVVKTVNQKLRTFTPPGSCSASDVIPWFKIYSVGVFFGAKNPKTSNDGLDFFWFCGS